jgi:hypothetical protein
MTVQEGQEKRTRLLCCSPILSRMLVLNAAGLARGVLFRVVYLLLVFLKLGRERRKRKHEADCVEISHKHRG